MTERLHDDGFTIIELLISLVVLSSLLMLVTFALTGIGTLFDKGVNASRAQDASRDIASEVAQDLQLSDGQQGTSSSTTTADGYTEYAVCTSAFRYSYILGVQIGTAANQTPHVLWRDKNLAHNSCD